MPVMNPIFKTVLLCGVFRLHDYKIIDRFNCEIHEGYSTSGVPIAVRRTEWHKCNRYGKIKKIQFKL